MKKNRIYNYYELLNIDLDIDMLLGRDGFVILWRF